MGAPHPIFEEKYPKTIEQTGKLSYTIEKGGFYMLQFICYPKCTTCQRAKQWLDTHKIEYDLRDIKLDKPSLEELTNWYQQSGLPLRKFFNTSGLLYKSLELKNKLPNMTETEMLKLLATDGMLVKRPLLVSDKFILIGFKDSQWQANLLP